MANREAHLKYWAEAGVIKLSGPFSNDEGTVMNGSLIAIEVENRTEAEKLLANDPYMLAGLFAHSEIRAWKWLVGRNA